MKRSSLLIPTTLLLLLSSCNDVSDKTLLDYVDPFIGTMAHGHVFPGATTPFGMVQLSPDNGTNGWDWCSGYHYSDSMISGFSHTHLSGTGIGDLADILFLPSMEQFSLDIQSASASIAKLNRSRFSHDNEYASPGYYSVMLDNGVKVGLTATPRTGLQSYTAQRSGTLSLLLDLGFAINWDRPVDCHIVFDGEILSGTRNSSGWAINQHLNFASSFSRQPDSLVMIRNGETTEDNKVSGRNIACILYFRMDGGDELVVRTGISAADVAGAILNLKAEAEGNSFDEIRMNAGNMWNDHLSVIGEVDADPETVKVFYTALYHTMIAPNLYMDVDGRYRGTDGNIHQSYEFINYTVFSLWDTYRAAHPLFTITKPDMVPDFINTMLNIYLQQGKLPVWSLAGNETDCMVGYSAVPVIADAVHKGFKGFDYSLAWEAVKHTSMIDFRGLDHYRKYGYIPSDLENESVAKTLEYCIDDWCIAQMAGDLGYTDDSAEYLRRSRFYRNLFDPNTLFMRGRMSDGTWREPFEPLYSSHREDDYTEGNAWQYTWLVPHEVEGLIDLFGSRDMFITRLDSLFRIDESVKGEHASPDISGLIGQYAHGNEPSHHIAYLFSMAGDRGKTENMVRRIMRELYHSGKDGLCGNEDCGQMSAWYVFSALGFYPVNPADGKYILGSPAVNRAVINTGNGKRFTVTAENNTPDSYSVKEIYLNGEKLKRNYITHSEVMAGGELKFIMEK
ncbi:MAG: GH92 family glycosyl hydrolase [Bacteroidales bacterium]